MGPTTRRNFLVASAACVSARAATGFAAEPAKPLRAAVIGHTGRGNYGHGLDVVWTGIPGVQVVAVADPDEAGRAKAAAASGALRQYADYRQMLESEWPDLVSVAPRWIDQRKEMLLAAIKAGANVYSEKPFAADLTEADEVLAAAGKAGVKIAVAHQMRLSPSVLFLKKRIEEGLIGDLLQMHAFGKQDRRAGGEDLMVLGVHLFDLMRYFAGEPTHGTARVTVGGRDITHADARQASEPVGPIAGDEIEVQFRFERGVHGTFTSRAKLAPWTGHWGIELVGSKGTARILADIWPRVFVTTPTAWSDRGRSNEWKPIEGDPGLKANERERSTGSANRRVVDDLIAAVKEKREPVCSGRAAAKAVEMVMGVYRAALDRAVVEFPLKERKHPLS